MFERLIKPTRFQRISESAIKLAKPENLSEEQKQNILHIFKEEVETTESWGHFIEEEDLIKELTHIIVALDTWNKDHTLEKILAPLPSEGYNIIIHEFSQMIFDGLGKEIRKYFNVMPKRNEYQGNDKTWYSTHLSMVLAQMIINFI